MSDERAAPSRSLLVLQIVMLAALYIQTGWLGRQLSFPNSIGTLIWPPAGLALAALLLYGTRLWPGIFIGSAISTLLLGIDAPTSVGIAVVSTLKSLLAVVLLQRFVGFRAELDRLWDVGALILVGAVSSAAFATLGALALWFSGDLHGDNVIPGLWIWWRGDLGGVIAIAPFLLLLRAGHPAWSDLFADREFWAIASLLSITCVLAFSGVMSGEPQSFFAQLPFACLIWAGARFGPRGAVVVSFPTLLIAVFATAHGDGPFVTQFPDAGMSLIWLYCMSLGTTGLAIAAAVSQRDLAEISSHREANERLRIERVRMLLEQRERIMREMHDGLGGQLISVLSMVERGKASPSEIAEGLRRALDDMRIMIDSLESSGEGLTGLLGKLRARLEPMLRRNGLDVSWKVDPRAALDGFSPDQSLHCLRIIQESIANVIQHAKASHVRVTVSPFEADASTVSIEIQDDGIGGVPEVSRPGHGMKNMQVRAREMGGEIRFDSITPGRCVRLLVPVSRLPAS